ncbi:MAG TPA: electron transfer flavoprotein subunit alpha/FixB family protein [Acidimicrobiia bacterium]|nr:electron transfer flavoprotein subunit alpha/FixB family protein [Acidimicrobiia bacterium]
MSRVLVLVGESEELDRQALSLASTLGSVELVSVGPTKIGGADKAWQIESPVLSDYAPEAIAESLAQLIGQELPSAAIASGTERNNEIMAHLAALLDLPLATNVLTVSADSEDWRLTRVRWGGSLIEEATLSAFLKLLTVAPHSQPVWEGSGTPALEIFEPELGDELGRTRVRERVTLDEGITLTTAPVIVSGGRGVGSAEGFAVLEELAGLLGGAVGCSRVVTNNGWRSHRDQVGQTGTRVAPQLYMACGISGAIQHWVGMMAAKKVLAINTDPEAPMVTKADYAVIGDLHEVLPAIIAEIRRRQEN